MKKSREVKDSEAKVEEPTPQPIAEEAPPVVVDASDHITIEKFARSLRNKDLAGAYLHCEKLRKGVRKMPHAEWQQDYDAWLAAPRG